MLDNCSLGTKIAEIEKICTTKANDFRSHDGITLETPRGGSHMKQTGMLVVLPRGAIIGFWSRLGRSGQSANILSHQGLV